MEDTKSLCAKIPIELHNRVRASQEESGLNLNQYVEKLIIEYYQMKEMKYMAQTQTRTLALQISEELFARIKNHIDKTPHLTQKAFITELIIKALDEAETQETK
ncbi:4-oxalocrotonate tautomerase [Anaerotignum sp. MB30-C6]|uniref:4-oxalocrotonate tautomerase n=1 Tax=Anaerotignum sp. MB30-C6 TaxID=3070814 RepID=UPI0027DBAA98|nr:4-oxalocrotonate tautomerase [Anaerotignum sp. MB30-C6]WMI82419.1 4-oxalocrotonate tautomerase [Anaerotignum sp. MB30-C6]